MTFDGQTYGEFWDFSYQSFYKKGQRFRRPQDAMTQSLKEFLAWDKVQPAPSAVLDAGCGDGLNAVFIAQAGYAVTGIDASPLAIERAVAYAAEADVHVQFCAGDIRKMSQFADGEFAVAIDNKTFHALWTYDDRAQYLRELRRVVAPGGTLFFRQCSVPAELRDEFGWTECLGKPIAKDITPQAHDVPPGGPGIWPNSLPKYREQLEVAGFEVARAIFYKKDPEPVSVCWCVRT